MVAVHVEMVTIPSQSAVQQYQASRGATEVCWKQGPFGIPMLGVAAVRLNA
jgi:hypothetical protein